MPPTRSPRFHGSVPPNMLEENSMFSHASGFTSSGGTFYINPQQAPPVILSPANRPSGGGGPYWAGYIAHLEARLAALEAMVNLNPVDSHGLQRTPAMENIFDPYNQPEYGDHVWSTEFSSRDMDVTDRRDVGDVSGDWSGHNASGDVRDARATGVERLQPGPTALSSTSQAFMMPKLVEHRPEPSNFERTSVEPSVAPHSLAASVSRRASLANQIQQNATSGERPMRHDMSCPRMLKDREKTRENRTELEGYKRQNSDTALEGRATSGRKRHSEERRDDAAGPKGLIWLEACEEISAREQEESIQQRAPARWDPVGTAWTWRARRTISIRSRSELIRAEFE
ncbi:hypothetical protein DFH09DRAFT_1111303 [Mycena vulgaris]|nr:hypothetical protein DFH09DRAFT_1111303 [Mycena vulgaris]